MASTGGTEPPANGCPASGRATCGMAERPPLPPRWQRRQRELAEASSSSSGSDRRSSLPIDRGWAWVVVAASSGIYGLHAGFMKTSGLVYLRTVEKFRSDPKLTLWIFSASGLVSMVAAPLISFVLRKTSHRFIAVTGSIIAAVGIVSTAYAPDIETTFLTVSLIYAIGVSCLVISSLTCTVPYFDQYRGLAVGITAVGGGVMSFVLPNVVTALFDTYTYDGALLVIAGIILQAVWLGALLRPISIYADRLRKFQARDEGRELKRLPPRTRSAARAALQAAPADTSAWTESDAAQADRCVWTESGVRETSTDIEESQLATSSLGQQLAEGHCVIEQVPKMQASASAQPRPPIEIAKQPFARSLLKSEKMWMIGLIMVFASNGMSIIFTAMAAHGDAIGLPPATTSLLISIGGALEIVCRCLHGWFSDRHVMPALVQLGLCTGLTGVSAGLCPIIGGATGLGLLAAMCGACGMSIYSLVIVVMRELLGADKVTSAMGIQMFFQAASLILSTLAIVYTTEASGSWHYVFYFIGGNMMLSSLLSLAYALTLKIREPRETVA